MQVPKKYTDEMSFEGKKGGMPVEIAKATGEATHPANSLRSKDRKTGQGPSRTLDTIDRHRESEIMTGLYAVSTVQIKSCLCRF